jgi:putative intracellular protease/amidase
MFDIAQNLISIALIREFYDAGKYIATVCHGSAAVVNVTLADGSHLIAGEKVTGYSNVEEKIADPEDKLEIPFLLEDELDKYSGELYEKSAVAFDEHLTVSSTKKLIMGQNPASAKGLASELLKNISVSE